MYLLSSIILSSISSAFLTFISIILIDLELEPPQEWHLIAVPKQTPLGRQLGYSLLFISNNISYNDLLSK